MKKFLSLIISACTVLALLMPLTAFAATSASVSKKEVNLGDTVSVTFTTNCARAVGSVDTIITFDESKLTYTSSNSSLGGLMVNPQGGTIKTSDYAKDPNSTSSKYTLTIVFKAKAVGTAEVALASNDISDNTDKGESAGMGAGTASVSISIKAKDTTLSSNCNLKDLQPPAGCTLSPKFSANVTEYTCTVPYSVKSFPLEPVRADSKSKVSYFGSVSLAVGENTRGVKVTAQDGTVKTYTVKITRLAENAATPSAAPDITPTPTPADGNPTVNVDGKNLEISRTIISDLPEGFEKEPFEYNGTEVESAVLSSLRILELSDGETSAFYIYNNGKFEIYISIKVSGNAYSIIADCGKDTSALENVRLTLKNGTEINGWKLPVLGDGYYAIAVMNNATGEKYMAVYCTFDGSVQKMSDNLLNSTDVVLNTSTPSPSKNVGDTKLLILGGACLLVAALAAVIIVLANKHKPKKQQHDWEFENNSDPYDITVDSNTDDYPPESEIRFGDNDENDFE